MKWLLIAGALMFIWAVNDIVNALHAIRDELLDINSKLPDTYRNTLD